jgi:hypothetical protein
MSQAKTLLADICDFACSRGADSLEVEFEDGRLFVYAYSGGTGVSIADFERSSSEAGELLDNLHSAARRPANAMIAGHPSKLHVRIGESFGEQTFEVTIKPAASAAAPGTWSFTPKQGQYLAYIYHYSKIHKRAPSEADLQGYFRVTPPSVHNMIIALERNGLIERTPGQARSIRLLVPPERLPPLE